MMEENYIMILIQSLEKKVMVLGDLSKENAKQKQLLQEDELDLDAFRDSVDKKEALIEQITFLDDGFEKMYDHVKDALNDKKHVYENEIMHLKELVSKVTGQAADIQREEANNQRLAERQFSSMKKKVRQVKDTKQVANKYYQTMAKLNHVEPQFMDKKK